MSTKKREGMYHGLDQRLDEVREVAREIQEDPLRAYISREDIVRETDMRPKVASRALNLLAENGELKRMSNSRTPRYGFKEGGE